MKRFRNTKYLVDENGGVFNSETNRYLKLWITNGYLFIGLGAKFRISIHRLVAELYCKGVDLSLDVNHKDGNKLNNHYTNLEWCTRSQNCQHSYDNGLSKRRFNHKNSIGSKNARAELDENKVIEIRKLYKTGKYTYTDLGKKYNVNQATIGYIVTRQTWKHVE